MTYLSSLERSKIKFFTATILIISDEYLSKDFDPFQYSQIQSSIVNCETAFNAIGSNSLVDDTNDSTAISATTRSFPLQNVLATRTVKVRLSYAKSLTRYYSSIDKLFTALGYVY